MIQIVLLVSHVASAWAESVPSQREKMKTLLEHAAFYNKQGHRAETECYLRLAQRLDLTNPFLKEWFRKWAMDRPRDIVLRLGALWGGAFKGPKPRHLIDKINPILVAVSAEKLSEAAESAAKLAEELKSSYGENDLDHLEILEILGDLHVLQDKHLASISVLTTILEIRKKDHPSIERDFESKQALGRIMSKLADAYWIVGQDAAAAALRNDPRTAQGDLVRLKDIEFRDGIGALQRGPATSSPEHPLCMPTIEARTK